MTQAEALTILKTGANVFLTGEPGSGKTHTINAFVAWLRACGIDPSITAATGIAATQVGGMTLHAWSGIGVHTSLSKADVDFIASKEHVARRIQKADVLIIDEISMLSASTFEMADAVCREVRRSDAPFGGLTVIAVGDFFQLPPVGRGSEAAFAYTSRTWRELNFITCYLTEQFRQDDDQYLSVLSAIRRGDVEELHYEALVARQGEALVPEDTPRLYSHNADVDRINAAELAKIPGKTVSFRMSERGKEALVEGLKRGCLSPEVLELKEGATVMFTKNAPQGTYVNGTLGTVTGFDAAGYPIVATREGRTVVAEPMEWQLEEGQKVKASISQVPLRLAYAMTVHKSQGMSMDAAVMDLSKAFEYGQGYVALSRVRRLAGVFLLGINARALEVHPEILERDHEFRAASEAAREAFADMSTAETKALQEQFIKALGGAWREDAEIEVNSSMPVPGRLAETLQALRDHRSLPKIAKARGLTPATIVKHLEELAELGVRIENEIGYLLTPEAADEIHEALKVARGDKLSPVFHALGGRHSFEAIRLARLLLR